MHSVYVCWTIVVKRISDSEELSYSGQTICNFNRTSFFTTDTLFFFATDILLSVLECYNCYEHFFRALPSDFPIHSRTLYTHTLIAVSLADKHLVFLWLFYHTRSFLLWNATICVLFTERIPYYESSKQRRKQRNNAICFVFRDLLVY